MLANGLQQFAVPNHLGGSSMKVGMVVGGSHRCVSPPVNPISPFVSLPSFVVRLSSFVVRRSSFVHRRWFVVR